MADLKVFLEQHLGVSVPMECRTWLRRHVDPEAAIDDAYAVHLLWLSSLVQERNEAEAEALLNARVELRHVYEVTQRFRMQWLVHAATDGVRGIERVGGDLQHVADRLRTELAATEWWRELVEQWERRQTRGLGVARYEISRRPMTASVRGTHVGCFAVREVRWPVFLRHPPALRHRERTPDTWRHARRPQHLYAVDLIDTGQSLGTFASAAVAFEVADRFDRRRVVSGAPPRALQRLLDVYRGSPPPLEARSWPAEPHWRFATCRRRAWGRRGPERRGVRASRRSGVRDER